MKILYIGDVMGDMGVAAVEKILPGLRTERGVDVVIAQGENVSDGKGLSVADYHRLRSLGVDVLSGGDHTIDKPEIFPLLEDANEPVIGPANMPDCPGPGYKYAAINGKRILVVSVLGNVVGRHADREIENPLQKIDQILARESPDNRDAVVVNFHGDYSSEKVIVGYYLDGRVSAVIGDHWHVPTADAEVLPKGTAHLTDVGMCGSLDSSLGVTFESVLPRWRDGLQTRNQLEIAGRSQFNALLVTIDDATGKATAAEHIRKVW
ncbi:MAG TPA: TIGR00282 family metallophosphoesterase [Candidatus Saccharimonadales bacterium]|nr:TIGR00282 family metallophosphoesterase [Candidatus Saccharimonadales bacterium]